MTFHCLHDRKEIHAFLRQKPYLHLYELGDLDDFMWPYTSWYALVTAQQIRQVVMLYTELPLPVLLGMTDDPAEMRRLLELLDPILPRRFYAHLRSDVVSLFAANHVIDSQGDHYRMAMTNPALLNAIDTSEVVRLTLHEQTEIEQFYERSYPGHFFVPRMLETGFYYGIRRAGELVSVAGLHNYSAAYRVACLGNITTLAEFRGKGLATQATAALCKALRTSVDYIGLNVHAENRAAIACYERLGFTCAETFGEYILERI